LALLAVVRLLIRRRGAHSAGGAALDLALLATIVCVAGSLLILTVAPREPHARLSGTARAGDPVPSYAGALGGNGGRLIDWYQLSTELPSFVGNPTYKGEQLMMWYPPLELRTLTEPAGMFHDGFDSLDAPFAILTGRDKVTLARRRPAELLLLSPTGDHFETALQSLAPDRPVLIRTKVMRQGPAVLHVWLIVLGSFARHDVS
jgi:hypothetical protein